MGVCQVGASPYKFRVGPTRRGREWEKRSDDFGGRRPRPADRFEGARGEQPGESQGSEPGDSLGQDHLSFNEVGRWTPLVLSSAVEEEGKQDVSSVDGGWVRWPPNNCVISWW